MTDSEKFKAAEDKGRDAAIKVFSRDIIPSDWKIEEAPARRYYDAIISKDGVQKALVEIKYRNVASTTYEDAILTDSKYERLRDSSLPTFYIALYSDNRYYIWNVKKTTPEKTKQWCNSVTVLGGPKVEKTAYHFRFEDASYSGHIDVTR